MTARDDCPSILLTQADFDGELDAAQAAQAAEHRASCPHCQAAYAELARLRTAMRAEDLSARAPESLHRAAAGRARGARPAPAAPRMLRWRAAGNFTLGAATAAAVAFVVFLSGQPSLLDQVVDDHVRALQPGHLEDVVSTDRHTVKPWFDGRIDFAPPVKDLADRQFPLLGGRLDYLHGRAVAALVYGRDKHVIDLLVWPHPANAGGGAVEVTARNGYNVIHWSQGGMTFWAVSDLEKSALADFVALWRAAP